MEELIGCGLVFIAFILLRFFFTYPKKLWYRLNPILQSLLSNFQSIFYWALLIAGLALCFVSSVNMGFLTLGCFLYFYNGSLAVLSLHKIPILGNNLAVLIGVILLTLGLTLFFITSIKHGFIALGVVLLFFLIVRSLVNIEIVIIRKMLKT